MYTVHLMLKKDCNSNFAKHFTIWGWPIVLGFQLLKAGQSSTNTNKYSGKDIVEGFLEMKPPLLFGLLQLKQE